MKRTTHAVSDIISHHGFGSQVVFAGCVSLCGMLPPHFLGVVRPPVFLVLAVFNIDSILPPRLLLPLLSDLTMRERKYALTRANVHAQQDFRLEALCILMVYR